MPLSVSAAAVRTRLFWMSLSVTSLEMSSIIIFSIVTLSHPPPDSYVEILMSNVMILGGWPLRGTLVIHEDPS